MAKTPAKIAAELAKKKEAEKAAKKKAAAKNKVVKSRVTKNGKTVEKVITNKGLIYEKKIRGIFRPAVGALVSKNVKMSTATSGGNDNQLPDMVFMIDGVRYGVEIKLDKTAQMGNPGSFRYNYGSTGFGFVNNGKNGDALDQALVDKAIDEVSGKEGKLDKIMEFLRDYPSGGDYNAENFGSLPIYCSLEAWDAAVRARLVAPLNHTFTTSTDVVFKHYALKNIFYIQIGGGKGFYYMDSNPLNLNIPQLTGQVKVELRLKSRGKKPRTGLGYDVITAPYEAICRLHTTVKNSHYDLENRDHIMQLFGNF